MQDALYKKVVCELKKRSVWRKMFKKFSFLKTFFKKGIAIFGEMWYNIIRWLHLRLENGGMQFFDGSIDPRFFGHVVLLAPDGMIRIDEDIPMEKITAVRREAKRKVFTVNALRALRQVAPEHELRRIPNVVLVGGSAEDFEIPEMLMEEFASYRIVCGRGNIRRTEGPRNAVATGLVLSYLGDV